MMKYAWDETCQYLPFKLLIYMFRRIIIKRISFYTPTTHFTL